LLSDITKKKLVDCEQGRSGSAVGIQERSRLAADVPESRLWKCGAVKQRHLHTQRIKGKGVTFLLNFSLRAALIRWD
jgi:hypothetical protein